MGHAHDNVIVLDAVVVARHHKDVGDDHNGDEAVKPLGGDQLVRGAPAVVLGRAHNLGWRVHHHRLDRRHPLLLLARHDRRARLLLLRARKVVDDHAHKEVDREHEAHAHPRNRVQGAERKVVAPRCDAGLGRPHDEVHGRIPRVAAAHHVQQAHRVPKVVERPYRRVGPPPARGAGQCEVVRV